MSENDECCTQENNFDTIENIDNMEDWRMVEKNYKRFEQSLKDSC